MRRKMQKLLAVMLLGTNLIDSQTNSAYAMFPAPHPVTEEEQLKEFTKKITETKETALLRAKQEIGAPFDQKTLKIKKDFTDPSIAFAERVRIFLEQAGALKAFKNVTVTGETSEEYIREAVQDLGAKEIREALGHIFDVFEHFSPHLGVATRKKADKETLEILKQAFGELKAFEEKGHKDTMDACFTNFSTRINKMKEEMKKLQPTIRDKSEKSDAEATTRTEKYEQIMEYIRKYEAKIKEESKDEKKHEEITRSAEAMDRVFAGLNDGALDSEGHSILDKIHGLLFGNAGAEGMDEKGSTDPRSFITSKAAELKEREERSEVIKELKTKCVKNPKALHAIFKIASDASNRCQEEAWKYIKGMKVDLKNYDDRKEAEAALCYDTLKNLNNIQTRLLSDVATIVLPEKQNSDVLNDIAVDTAESEGEVAPKAKDGFEDKLRDFFQKCVNINNGQVINLKNFETLAKAALDALKTVSAPLKKDDDQEKMQECIRKWEMIRSICNFIHEVAQKQKSQQGRDASKKSLTDVDAAKKAEYERLGVVA
jgi:hypothetical protein